MCFLFFFLTDYPFGKQSEPYHFFYLLSLFSCLTILSRFLCLINFIFMLFYFLFLNLVKKKKEIKIKMVGSEILG